MSIQTIWSSDRKAGKLRCQTCEQLFSSKYYPTLVKKGCGCGQQFQNASADLELRAKAEYLRVRGMILAGELNTDDEESEPPF